MARHIFTGTGAPTFAPTALGQHYIDTASGTHYNSKGIATSADWVTGGGGVSDHNLLTNKGTNTHAQIDSHLASTSNPHSVTKSQVGLGNVDNTSDVNKPISTATQTALNGKEGSISAGTTSQYWRGDKSWQTLDKSAVGLGNVDNTSDVNKPISTATQTALNGKEDTANKNAVNGYAGLDASGFLSINQIPSAITLNRSRAFLVDHFTGATTTGELGWLSSVSGTGAALNVTTTAKPSTGNSFGVWSLSTGTTATGRAGLQTQAVGIDLINMTIEMEWRVYINSRPSATEEALFIFGLGDSLTAEPTDGAYFLLNNGINGSNWALRTSSNATRTTVNTSTSANIGTWYKLQIRLTTATANFYIDDVFVGTINNNIPQGNARLLGFQSVLIKSLGSTSLRVTLDYFLANCYLGSV